MTATALGRTLGITRFHASTAGQGPATRRQQTPSIPAGLLTGPATAARALPSPRTLHTAIDEASRLARATPPEAPASGDVLADRYAGLGRAEALASAALIASENALASGGGPARVAAYRAVRDRALQALRDTGAGYAAHMPVFAATVHGGKSWPTLTEQSPAGERRYVNSFKSSENLTFAQKEEIYRGKVEKFEKAGGTFSQHILTPESLSELRPGVRYDYVLLEDGTIRCAERGPNLPDPGHALLAEGGPDFADTRVMMAGELRVVAAADGTVLACVAACSSGHFKPYFEDVERMRPALARLGLPEERAIVSGGPDDPAAILREIAARFELKNIERLFPPAPGALLEGFAQQSTGALRPWQIR